MYLFVLYRLAKKCTKTYNSCRAIAQLIKSFVLRRFRCVVVCVRSLPSRAIKSHCVDVSVLCMLLYLLFKPRGHWKFEANKNVRALSTLAQPPEKSVPFALDNFRKFIPEFLVGLKAPHIQTACLVPRPQYFVAVKRFGSRGPGRNATKTRKLRQSSLLF